MNRNRLIYAVIMTLPLYAASQSWASPINLGTAANFTILTETGISTTGATAIVGDIGVSPYAATAITGFGLIIDSTGTFARSPLVTGKVYAADYASPTPTYLLTAIGDMQTAYTNGIGLPAVFNEYHTGLIGGLTLAPGVYKWGTGVSIPASIYLSGGPNDFWVFQIAGTLDISSAQQVILEGGAQAGNVFWLVAGQTTLETYSQFVGIILDKTAVVLQTGASLDGAVLAQTASTSDDNAISDVSVIPEPGTFLLLGLGLAWLLAPKRKVVRCAA